MRVAHMIALTVPYLFGCPRTPDVALPSSEPHAEVTAREGTTAEAVETIGPPGMHGTLEALPPAEMVVAGTSTPLDVSRGRDQLADDAPEELRRVVERWGSYSHHGLGGWRSVVVGPWGGVPPPDAERLRVIALGAERRDCVAYDTVEDGRNVSEISCPGVGVIERQWSEGGAHYGEIVLALRSDGETTARGPCEALQLLGDDEIQRTCPVAIREGTPRRTGLACARFFQEPRDHEARTQRHVLVVRVDPDERSLRRWLHVADDLSSPFESGTSRTWIVREAGWSAAVRIDRASCGDADGEELARLAATRMPTEISRGPWMAFGPAAVRAATTGRR